MQFRPLAAALVCAAACVAFAPAPARADGWSDFWVGYRYGTNFREPTNPNPIAKNIPQLQYVSGNKMGTTFVNVDMLMSDGVDPAAGPATGKNGGAQEIYVVLRHELSMSGLMHHSMKSAFVSDLGLTGGMDINAKDDNFAPRVRKYFIGPTVNFPVPGYAQLSFFLRAEQNHNGIVGTYVGFKGTYQLEGAWGINFNLGGPAKLVGFFDYTGAKGPDGFGGPTAPELLAESQVLWDVSGKKKNVWAGIGYQHWHNKFGSLPGVGTEANTPQLEMEWHLP